jgi:hypothetical protein
MTFAATYPILDLPVMADNLMAYFEANQVAALTAVGGSALKPLQQFSDSVANRATPVFPAIAFRDDNDTVDYSGEALLGGYSATFEVLIQNQNPDTAVTQSRIYMKALKLMIRNIPDADLIANTNASSYKTFLDSIEAGTEAIRANEDQTDFLQMLTITARFGTIAEGFN